MSRFALFAGLMAASVAAQAEFTAPGFRYIGCVEAEPPVFDFKADVPAPSVFSSANMRAMTRANTLPWTVAATATTLRRQKPSRLTT